MKFGILVVACLSWIIRFRLVQNSRVCEEGSCDFAKKLGFLLDNATHRYSTISQLSQHADTCLNFVEGEFNPSIKRTLSQLKELHSSIESFEREDEFEYVPETLIGRLEVQKETNEKLEERYDKLLSETELAIGRLSVLYNRVKEREKMIATVEDELVGFTREKFNLRQKINALTNGKMSRSEFIRSKRAVTLQLDRIRTGLLQILRESESYSLKEVVAEYSNSNRKLSQLSAEVRDIRRSIEDTRRSYNKKLDAIEKDVGKIRESLSAKEEEEPIAKKITKAKFQGKKKDDNALSIAEILKARKENKQING